MAKKKRDSEAKARRHKFRATDNSRWQFWKDGATQSFIGSFLNCREQTRMAFVEGWTNVRPTDALHFGSTCHHVAHRLSEKRSMPSQVQVLSAVNEFEDSWCAQIGGMAKTDDAEVERLQKVYGMSEILMDRYRQRWDGDWKKGKYTEGNTVVSPNDVVEAEWQFEATFTFDDGQTCPIRGKFDRVFRIDGDLWLHELKFRGRPDEDSIVDALNFDRQVMLYLWALRQLREERIRGVLFDVSRRPGQRWGKNDDMDSFLDRVDKDVNDESRADHYFYRFEMPISNKEIDAWFRNYLKPVMNDVRGWWQGDLPHYMNDDALVGRYGRSDMYGPIVLGSFDDHVRRTKAFVELEADY